VVDPAGKKLVMFGAGGAARAIGVECALAGATHVTVVNRSEDRGNELISLLNEKTPVEAVLEKWDGDYTVSEGVDVVINATSIGLADAEARLALDMDSLTQNMVVADVIPNPPRTMLVRDAEDKGCTVIDGLGMLVNQGITGIEYWTGETVDGNVMRARLEELFGD
ncbi:MAG TPA: shikimate dehydrogenase, partial [Verrucomicrobiota bacterium]|nr:shikimate dehydrogenase [Verrucomicrobiota bacterium]